MHSICELFLAAAAATAC
uniref:Uncharacterized protein n=1 Tax=Anguilla anguilla TaxID=7936 RepID=A0A0E9UIN7_ANGAN